MVDFHARRWLTMVLPSWMQFFKKIWFDFVSEDRSPNLETVLKSIGKVYMYFLLSGYLKIASLLDAILILTRRHITSQNPP